MYVSFSLTRDENVGQGCQPQKLLNCSLHANMHQPTLLVASWSAVGAQYSLVPGTQSEHCFILLSMGANLVVHCRYTLVKYM